MAGYKINTQKSLAFLYTNNEKSEREIKESIPFTIAMKKIKYLGVNLPKETKELYTENYKTLMKAEHQRMMLLNCGVGEDLRVPWTARRSSQSILKEICPGCSLEGLMLQYFGHLM